MIGVIVEFLDNSPFYENTVFIRCVDWQEFNNKLAAQFDSEAYYMHIDCLDAANHNYDAEFSVGNYSYYCNHQVINKEI